MNAGLSVIQYRQKILEAARHVFLMGTLSIDGKISLKTQYIREGIPTAAALFRLFSQRITFRTKQVQFRWSFNHALK